jgi:hypothetical protein
LKCGVKRGKTFSSRGNTKNAAVTAKIVTKSDSGDGNGCEDDQQIS